MAVREMKIKATQISNGFFREGKALRVMRFSLRRCVSRPLRV